MLAQGWTVNDPADLDELGLGHLVGSERGRRVRAR